MEEVQADAADHFSKQMLATVNEALGELAEETLVADEAEQATTAGKNVLFVCLFVQLFIWMFGHSCIHSFVQSSIHPTIPPFIHALPPCFLHFHSFTHAFIQSFLPACIFIPPFVHATHVFPLGSAPILLCRHHTVWQHYHTVVCYSC